MYLCIILPHLWSPVAALLEVLVEDGEDDGDKQEDDGDENTDGDAQVAVSLVPSLGGWRHRRRGGDASRIAPLLLTCAV